MTHFIAEREKVHSNLLGLHIQSGAWLTDERVRMLTAGYCHPQSISTMLTPVRLPSWPNKCEHRPTPWRRQTGSSFFVGWPSLISCSCCSYGLPGSATWN
jgi:hypothetical protein